MTVKGRLYLSKQEMKPLKLFLEAFRALTYEFQQELCEKQIAGELDVLSPAMAYIDDLLGQCDSAISEALKKGIAR